MKANELQIGDWVYSSFFGKTRVTSLKEYEGYGWVMTSGSQDWKADASLSPIPITAEILEKNGFKKIDFSHYQINDRTLVLDADGKWDGELSWHWVVTEMSINSKGQNVVLDYYVATLNYVHQLQHALRLCGLNELAENFKI